jgi:hypothetical protein
MQNPVAFDHYARRDVCQNIREFAALTRQSVVSPFSSPGIGEVEQQGHVGTHK